MDYYANGGTRPQPGCTDEEEAEKSCSHIRALLIFAEAIGGLDGVQATRCGSWEEYVNGLCEGNEKLGLWGDLKGVKEGKYYFRTRDDYYYA